MAWAFVCDNVEQKCRYQELSEVIFRQCEPDIREIVGGWLATTPRDHPYRIGVVGQTAEEARRRFTLAWEAWKELHDRVEAGRTHVSV